MISCLPKFMFHFSANERIKLVKDDIRGVERRIFLTDDEIDEKRKIVNEMRNGMALLNSS